MLNHLNNTTVTMVITVMQGMVTKGYLKIKYEINLPCSEGKSA